MTIGSALAPFDPGLTVGTKAPTPPVPVQTGLRRQIEESLERLRTDTIELYYLHRSTPATRSRR